jgi:hypothetical protein
VETNYHESLYLRSWYTLWGCEETFSRDGVRHAKTLQRAENLNLGFHEPEIRWNVVAAYVNATQRPQSPRRHTPKAVKTKKERKEKAPTVEELLQMILKSCK